MKSIFGCAKPYSKEIIFAVLLMIVDVFCEVVQPTLMANILGPGIGNGDVGYIVRTGLIMVAVALVAIAVGCGNSHFSARAGVGFAANLRAKLFAKVQTFSFHNIDQFSTASLSTRLTNDVTQMQNLSVMSLRMMIRAPLMLPFALIMAIQINSSLALILGVSIPLLILIMVLLVGRAIPLFGKMQKAVDYLNRVVQENVTNMRVVKSFVRQPHEKEKFKGASEGQMNASMRAMLAIITAMPAMMFLMNATIVAVVYFGGRQIISDTLTVAEMTKFINYIMQVLMSLLMLAMMFMMISRASASYRRVREVLDTAPELEDKQEAQEARNTKGSVEFRDVSFKYDRSDTGESVLSHISFTAEPGETVALIGGTGAGKTTLVQLIARLYEVTQGEVLLDGKNVNDYTMKSLHSQVGMVLQNNTLFSGTIAENLRWGNKDATDEEMQTAARAAQAHSFISAFPDDYNTWIDQGGVNVSGGQKQRLCIARSLLRRPSVLILDDSTSAVDTATEQRLREAFRTELVGTTILLIAQRISSVQDADKIIVLDEGEIVGMGKHDALLETCEAYQEIYQSQMREEESA